MWEWWELRAKQPRSCYGVTGTNGKSSTVYFLHRIWTHLQIPNFATTGFGTHTWPDRGIAPVDKRAHKALKRKLHELHRKDVQRFAAEYYSYNLAHRLLDFVQLSGAAFLNLTPEHLGIHGSMEGYFAAKQRLFTEVIGDDTPTVIGGDCPYGQRLISQRNDPIVFGRDPSYPLHFDDDVLSVYGQTLPIAELTFSQDIYLLNLLCAVGLAIVDGAAIGDVLAILPAIKLPPGRMERVVDLSDNRTIYVDCAHNADGIEKTINYLKAKTGGGVTFVNSWKTRRRDFRDIHRVLNAVVDLTIITSDVEPDDLRSVHSGINNVLIIEDRRAAVIRAIELSRANDTIVVGGGHARWLDSATGRYMTDMELIRDITEGMAAERTLVPA